MAERFAFHMGAAMGTYRGFPAVFMPYFKQTPSGGSKQIGGNGISIYYRDGGAWKRARVFKSIETPVSSAGIAVGDLDAPEAAPEDRPGNEEQHQADRPVDAQRDRAQDQPDGP